MDTQNEAIRCFVAIELPENIKRVLHTTAESLRKSPNVTTSVKWVNTDAIHLTLKFLGSVPSSRLDDMKGALQRACADTIPLHLVLGALGVFPSARNPRVIWVGLESDEQELSQLAGYVDDAMAELGFPRETRPFTPHLTLGRVRQEVTELERCAIRAALGRIPAPESATFDAREVSLMRSHLSPQGARYTCLDRVRFREPDA
ncbi:MAG: RNA 2',3'-cyclic phosphodiesterase [Chloroflexota bacterium]